MKINSSVVRGVTPFLISSVLALPFERATLAAPAAAHGGMISTGAFLQQHLPSERRERIMNLLKKEDVLRQLEKYGVSADEAKLRVASLSDAEVEALNHKIDQLPAGADAAGAILGTALFVFLVLLITDILCLTKVFHFTRCAR